MNEMERTDNITRYEPEDVSAAIVAIEIDGRRYVFAGNISGFELSREDGYSSMSAMFMPRAEHDLTVHFVGDVVQQVQEATHDRT